ncbi:MAG: hypothetical protein R3B46_08265 [Phycisphaerales bacterium]|nr:hypothetical protein [Phycisphaerales bacterium]
MSITRRTVLMLILAAVAAFTLVGCGGGESAYVGQWELDKEAFKAAAEAAMTEEEKNDPMAGMAMGMLMSMNVVVDIKSDHTFSATMSMPMMGEDTTTGTWKLEKGGIVMTAADGNSPGKMTLKGGKLHAQAESKDDPPFILKPKAKS